MTTNQNRTARDLIARAEAAAKRDSARMLPVVWAIKALLVVLEEIREAVRIPETTIDVRSHAVDADALGEVIDKCDHTPSMPTLWAK